MEKLNTNRRIKRKANRARKTINPQDRQNSSLANKVETLSFQLQKPAIAEYVEYMRHPKKVIFMNFFAGIARGFGAVIGATVLVALFLYFLSFLISLNIPHIGKYIAELVKIVEKYL